MYDGLIKTYFSFVPSIKTHKKINPAVNTAGFYYIKKATDNHMIT